jgi:hypothetical protein
VGELRPCTRRGGGGRRAGRRRGRHATRPGNGPVPRGRGEIRIHGNWATPDAQVVRIAGLATGQALGPRTLDEVARRLRGSGRFDEVEIRKRHRSLTDTSQVVLVVVVVERAGRENGPGFVRPVQKVTGRILFFPILDYTDGYGFTYGARASFVDLAGERGRVSVPLTWGGTRRAAVELDKGPARGPVDRLTAGASISQRENPHYALDDQRNEAWAGVERGLRGPARVEFRAGLTDVEFGTLDDTFASYRVGVVLDTRGSPTTGFTFWRADATIAGAGDRLLSRPASSPGLESRRSPPLQRSRAPRLPRRGRRPGRSRAGRRPCRRSERTGPWRARRNLSR